MKKILLSVLPLVAFSATSGKTESRTVSGRVTDRDTGQGLPGVTVLQKGTTNGVSTNSDGTFTLTVPASGGTLVFSSVGFLPVEQAIGDQNQFTIGLSADSRQLSEVVVTGYGQQQERREISGAIATIKSSEFKD
ncbi:carboxypeptidase-like regulatory domain-containing protein [Hymenobacter aerophilus]|uniref:carboxypeptidase-like regulatory domain-containing protein n=1 Tax=Hymenobacter aerophilus TaxID=119644 RepID=UPI000363F530|nr:carboxypeptidase-like regulatory domain-containing protein [Hymenobacter aerophilus]